MTSVDSVKFDNFFELFEQPLQFEISQKALDERFRHLQKYYHPDNVDKNTINKDEQLASDQASSIINQAYQTLSHPDSRATYLLDLSGQAQTLDHSIADLDFLDDAMQLRIDLEDAIDDKNRSELELLHPQITKRLAMQSHYFMDAYQVKDWRNAIDATQKLKFLVKLDADIIAALDDLIIAQHDDDDLYV